MTNTCCNTCEGEGKVTQDLWGVVRSLPDSDWEDTSLSWIPCPDCNGGDD